MKNLDVLELFDQTHDVRIDKLIWIAAMFGNQYLVDFFNDGYDNEDFENLFPWINDYDFLTKDDLQEMLVGTNKLGFIGRISVPEHSDFSFDEAVEFQSCSVHEGIRHATFVYAETIEDLLPQIEAKAEDIYQRFVDKEKKKQGLIA